MFGMNDGEFKQLYPTLSDDELNIARENLDRYLELAWEIFEEMRADATIDGHPQPS